MLVIRKVEAGEKRANVAQQRELLYKLYNLDMLIKEISEITEDVGLDNVDLVGVTEVLESHSQPLSNEELYGLAQQFTEQQKENADEEDRGTKAMQTKGLTDNLSAIDVAAESYVISTLTGNAPRQ